MEKSPVSANASLSRREFLRAGAGAAIAAAAAPGLPATAWAHGDFSRLDALGQAELVRSGADEATLFSLAFQLEEAQPWSNRRPSVFA
jgi:hypothetical protein